MRFPVDITKVQLVCGGESEPSVVYETGEQRTNRKDEPLYPGPAHGRRRRATGRDHGQDANRTEGARLRCGGAGGRSRARALDVYGRPAMAGSITRPTASSRCGAAST